MRERFVFFVTAVLLAAAASAQEVSSIRDSQFEWQCETTGGSLISGHTRQDKAFQSCINRALADGNTYIVRGGTYRINASDAVTPPDPEPDPDPDPEPSDETPLVTFGPLTGIVEYPSTIAALKQDTFRWELTFTTNDVDKLQGLASRDLHGRDEPGHLSVWIEAGKITVRHQDVAGGHDDVYLESTTELAAGDEYIAVVSVDPDVGIALYVDGVLEDADPWAAGLAGNDLPLVVGGRCSTCRADGSVGPGLPIDGSVALSIYDDTGVFTPPQSTSLELRWTNPTERTDDEPLVPSELLAINAYKVSPGARQRLAGIDTDQTSYEVSGLARGTEYCFVVTAVAVESDESADSNTVCKAP